MSNLARVGQHFILGLRPTPTLHPQDRKLLRDLRPAGVVLFKSNFSHDRPYCDWLGRHGDLIASIREAVGRERLLLLSITRGAASAAPRRQSRDTPMHGTGPTAQAKSVLRWASNFRLWASI
jgi:hypothetical protein